MRQNTMRPERVYLVQSAWRAFAFSLFITVNLIWQAEVAGLNPLQLVLVGTALEVVCFLGEVPTGIVADVYGRRVSVILGFVLFGAGCLLEGLFPVFWVILLAQVIWGTGDTFISGALDAWLADEVGEERLPSVYLRASQVAQGASLAAIPLGVFLGNAQLNLPIVAAALLLLGLAAFLAVFMRETHFSLSSVAETRFWSPVAATLTGAVAAVRARPVIITILIVAAFHGMASEGIDRLFTPHFLYEVRLPDLQIGTVTWFGILTAVATVLAIISAELVRHGGIREHRAMATVLLVLGTGQALSVVAFALAPTFPMAAAGYWATHVFRRTMGPISQAWLNRGIDPRVRATVLSIAGQSDALGQIVGGPLIGLAATAISTRAGLVLAGLVLTPALVLYARSINGGGRIVAEEPSIDEGELR